MLCSHFSKAALLLVLQCFSDLHLLYSSERLLHFSARLLCVH